MGFGRKGNVVRGEFGKRRISPGLDSPSSREPTNNWLDPDAYDALSPQEKRDLWARRQIERKHNSRRRNHRQRRTSTDRRWLEVAIVAAMVIGVSAWQLKPSSWFDKPIRAPSGADSVTAIFSFCHTGGGYNCVVDGDTIWLEGQKIRIADIDAPETHDYSCPSEKALGDQATQRLIQLLGSGPVTLSSIDRDEDPYGRKLRRVFVNGKSVGDTLVSEGLARYYRGGRRSWC